MNADQICTILASQDQDVEDGKTWMRETDTDDLIQLWLYMEQNFMKGKHRGCRELEIMSRFAAVGFTHILLMIEAQKNDR